MYIVRNADLSSNNAKRLNTLIKVTMVRIYREGRPSHR